MLKFGLIRLLEWHLDDLRVARRQPAYEERELKDRGVLRMADVEHLARGVGMLDERDHRVDHVAHPRERAPLLPVAMNGDRLALESLRDEACTTIPYWPVWRGPNVLNSRTTVTGNTSWCA